MNEKIIPLVPNSIIAVKNFFSSAECQKFINLSEAIGYEPAPITTNTGSQIRPDIRNNSRIIFDDISLANNLWQRISASVPQPIRIPISIRDLSIENWQPIGLNERFRFYRYDRKQKFSPHYDGTYKRSEDEASQVTFMIYLNDDFMAGETKFYLHSPYFEVTVKPEKGMALCFLHNFLHEGTAIEKGRKYVLRTDVMYRRKIVKQKSSILKS